MDGPSLVPSSGGFEVGSAVVSLSLETSGAEQKLAAFQGQLQALVSGNYSVPMGASIPTGTVTPMQGPGQVAAGLGSFAAGGGGFGAQRLEIDTSQAMAQVQALKNEVRELQAMMSSTGPAATSATPAGYSGNGPSGRGGSQWWNRQSYRSLGLPIGAFMGLEAAGHVAQGVYQSNYIAAHPEESMAPYSGSVLAGDPNIQAIAAQQQAISGKLAVKSTIESIPALGSYLSAFDIGEGSRFDLEKRRGRLDREASLIGETIALNYRSSALEVASTGDEELIYRQSQAKELADWRQKVQTARGEARRAGGRLLSETGYDVQQSDDGNPRMYANMPGGTDSGAKADFDRLTSEATAAVAALSRFTSAVDSTANRIGAIQSAHVASSITAAGADLTVAGRGFGSVPAAESMLQQSELFVPVAEYMQNLTSGPLGMPSGIGLSQAGANINRILSSQAKDNSQATLSRTRLAERYRTRAAAAQAGAGGFEHTARMVEFDASSRLEIEDAGRQGVDISGSVNTERQAVEDAARREADLRAGASMQRATISGLRSQHRDFEASMTELHAHYSQRSNQIKSDSPGAAREQMALLLEHRSAAGQLTAEHEFGMKVANEGYDARISASHEQESLRPMNASATLEVAQARREVANASPYERAKVVAANEAELKAHKGLLTAQRGGLTAVDMSAHEAMGLMSSRGVDLTGHDIDVRETSRTYDKGISGLSGAPKPGEGGGHGGAGGGGDNAAQIIAKAAQDFAKAVQQFVNGKGNGKWPMN